MRNLVNVLKGIVIVIWAVVAIFVTICLLSFNQYSIPVLGRTTLLIIDHDQLEPEFNRGDLVVITRTSDRSIDIGDNLLFYVGNRERAFLVNIGEVANKEEVSPTETGFSINNAIVSSKNVIGKLDDVNVMSGVGTLLGIFLSRWGFMFLVIFPTLFLLVYEIMVIIEEMQKLKKEKIREAAIEKI